MAARKPNITLYTWTTPNGMKISMALEELGIPYNVKEVDISKYTQKEDWFLKINPNGRVPAITDTFHDGSDISLFESGSILQYLVEQYDHDHKISYPPGTREHYQVNNWLFFQNAGVGPMQGQANYFGRYMTEKIPHAIDRYKGETRRLYGVLDKHLATSVSGFLVGDHISIADITTVGWVHFASWTGIDLDEFPHLKAWEQMMLARPGIKRGRDVPKKIDLSGLNQDELEKLAKGTGDWIRNQDNANK